MNGQPRSGGGREGGRSSRGTTRGGSDPDDRRLPEQASIERGSATRAPHDPAPSPMKAEHWSHLVLRGSVVLTLFAVCPPSPALPPDFGGK